MIVEPAVLEEELIGAESYKSVKEQLLSWNDHDSGVNVNTALALSDLKSVVLHRLSS